MSGISETYPIARMNHRCSICYRTILPGEKYRRAVYFDGGDVRDWKECRQCEVFVRYLSQRHSDFFFDDDYHPDYIADWEAQTPGEQSIKDAWCAYWKSPDGSLIETPVISCNENGKPVDICLNTSPVQ